MMTQAGSFKPLGLKVGVFGGTFNPVHVAHIQTVLEVKRALQLDALLLVPAATPPHKDTTHVASAKDRLAMLLLAISETPGVVVSDMELRRQGPSYSVDTIRDIRGLLPSETDLFFIIGRDAFLEIDSWRDYRAIFEETAFIVMRRPSDDADDGDDNLGLLLASRVSSGYDFDSNARMFRHPRLKSVYLFENTEHHVSATAIRDRIRKGMPIDGLVPEAVAAYIVRKGLYR